tara:strand:+ start:1060 stop:1287 length:228 start_codon:yes stop_codon:yes gene_type:complete
MHHALGNAGASRREADENGVAVAGISRSLAMGGDDFGHGIPRAAHLCRMAEQRFELGQVARSELGRDRTEYGPEG